MNKLDEIIKDAKLIISTKTIYTDFTKKVKELELKHWDAFRALVDKIEQGYVEDQTYKGLPMLSNWYHLLFDIYDAASELEKRMIFHTVVDRWDVLFRHWKTDMDVKWDKGHWQKHF